VPGRKKIDAGGSGVDGGRARETIVFLEQGKYVPSLKLACDIARVFDKKVEDMFFFD